MCRWWCQDQLPLTFLQLVSNWYTTIRQKRALRKWNRLWQVQSGLLILSPASQKPRVVRQLSGKATWMKQRTGPLCSPLFPTTLRSTTSHTHVPDHISTHVLNTALARRNTWEADDSANEARPTPGAVVSPLPEPESCLQTFPGPSGLLRRSPGTYVGALHGLGSPQLVVPTLEPRLIAESRGRRGQFRRGQEVVRRLSVFLSWSDMSYARPNTGAGPVLDGPCTLRWYSWVLVRLFVCEIATVSGDWLSDGEQLISSSVLEVVHPPRRKKLVSKSGRVRRSYRVLPKERMQDALINYFSRFGGAVDTMVICNEAWTHASPHTSSRGRVR